MAGEGDVGAAASEGVSGGGVAGGAGEKGSGGVTVDVTGKGTEGVAGGGGAGGGGGGGGGGGAGGGGTSFPSQISAEALALAYTLKTSRKNSNILVMSTKSGGYISSSINGLEGRASSKGQGLKMSSKGGRATIDGLSPPSARGPPSARQGLGGYPPYNLYPSS